MQTFLESQIFRLWLSDVFEECLHKRVCSRCLRQNEDFPLLTMPCILTPSRCHHVGPLDEDVWPQELPGAFPTHNYVHLIQKHYISCLVNKANLVHNFLSMYISFLTGGMDICLLSVSCVVR